MDYKLEMNRLKQIREGLIEQAKRLGVNK